jgi:hypothetical protein
MKKEINLKNLNLQNVNIFLSKMDKQEIIKELQFKELENADFVLLNSLFQHDHIDVDYIVKLSYNATNRNSASSGNGNSASSGNGNSASSGNGNSEITKILLQLTSKNKMKFILKRLENYIDMNWIKVYFNFHKEFNQIIPNFLFIWELLKSIENYEIIKGISLFCCLLELNEFDSHILSIWSSNEFIENASIKYQEKINFILIYIHLIKQNHSIVNDLLSKGKITREINPFYHDKLLKTIGKYLDCARVETRKMALITADFIIKDLNLYTGNQHKLFHDLITGFDMDLEMIQKIGIVKYKEEINQDVNNDDIKDTDQSIKDSIKDVESDIKQSKKDSIKDVESDIKQSKKDSIKDVENDIKQSKKDSIKDVESDIKQSKKDSIKDVENDSKSDSDKLYKFSAIPATDKTPR